MVAKQPAVDKTARGNHGANNHSPFGGPSLKLAIVAQSLYLVNLLALPGLTLIALFYLRWRCRNSDDALGVCHLRQTTILSLWFILLVVGGALLIWSVVGHSAAGIAMTLLYAIVMHTCFVLLGVLGLANAISGKHFHPSKNNNHCS